MMRMPTNLIRVDALAPGHPAAAYLLGRGFDPAELWARWKVAYCARSPDSYPALLHRLVFPIDAARIDAAANGGRSIWFELAGWQARAIDAKSNRPEVTYLTGLGRAKGKVIFGLPQAIETRGPVVVVEDATDVWRLGANAVATLGTGATQYQQSLLCDWFTRRPLVMLLDRCASDRATKLFRALRARRAGLGVPTPVVVASLPEGRDNLDECTRAEAWDAVAVALGQPLADLGLVEVNRSASNV